MLFIHRHPIPFKKILLVHFEGAKTTNMVILVKIQDFHISLYKISVNFRP